MNKGGTIVKPIYLSIQQQATGNRIRELLKENGYTVKDIQEVMGFENPQAVYKWISGRSLPSIDNFLILSKVLHTSIEDILVIDGDIVFLKGGKRMEKMNEIILFETEDKEIKLSVPIEQETVWLNRNQMADLFDRDVKTIGKHINNALREKLDA